jgi:hypothetical protein
MRKFTKSLMTLALLVVGTTSMYADFQLVYHSGAAKTNSWDKQATYNLPAPLEIGETYVLNADIKVVGTGEKQNIQLWALWNASENKNQWGGTNDVQYLAWMENITDEFATYTWTFTSTWADDQILFAFGELVGDVYFDNVSLKKQGDDTELVANGDFSQNSTTGWGANWGGPEFELIDPTVVVTYTDIITNGDLEGNENLHFTVTEQCVGGPFIAKIEDGIGVGGSRGIKLQSSDNPATDWDTQFFISVPKKLATGTKYKVSFDYKASQDASGEAQWHNAPGDYVTYLGIGSQSFTEEWQTYEKSGTIGQDHNGADMAPYTIAFNLAKTKTATTFYFDNIKFEVKDDDLAGLDDADPLTNPSYPTNTAFMIDEAGFTTFSYPYPVVFGDGIEVYAATYDNGGLKLTQIDGAARNTPVILKGEPGTYTATLQVPAPAAPAANDLLPSDGQVTGNGTIYALGNKSHGVGFYLVADGQTIPEGKAYLDLDNISSAPQFIGFDGGTTSISEQNLVKNNVEGVYYNLAGQRVAQPTKGLYIVNGKKIIK